jgi:predicted ABC-type transport system involved in lysophospholipase L1 biosynthesis ATPase subunit
VNAPLLSLDRVSKRHWRGVHEVLVLDRVSLDLFAGELVAVWGRRGAGKSTLLRIAAGMEAPDSGVVRFEGLELGKASRSRWAQLLRTEIGVVQRSGPSIPGVTMLDYVALPLLGEIGRLEAHRRAAQALARVGVADCCGAAWDSLSDGEQGLVAVAHAMVRGPKLVLADDPTAGLDVAEGEQVIDLLDSAARDAGAAVLMATPDVPDVRRSHRVLSIGQGRLVEPLREPGAVIDFESKRPRRGELG